jgi:hypothetical protein
MKTDQNFHLLCTIQKDDTDEILKNKMIDLESMLSNTQYKSGFLLTIGGYENDPRELWEIPEMKNFGSRLVRIGFISLLELSTQFKRQKDPDPMYGLTLGALEVWAISKGILSNAYVINNKNYMLFLDDLSKANKICDKVTRWKSKISFNK